MSSRAVADVLSDLETYRGDLDKPYAKINDLRDFAKAHAVAAILLMEQIDNGKHENPSVNDTLLSMKAMTGNGGIA